MVLIFPSKLPSSVAHMGIKEVRVSTRLPVSRTKGVAFRLMR
jgi:hypothetical protein